MLQKRANDAVVSVLRSVYQRRHLVLYYHCTVSQIDHSDLRPTALCTLSGTSVSALACSNRSTTSECPEYAAYISAVIPNCCSGRERTISFGQKHTLARNECYLGLSVDVDLVPQQDLHHLRVAPTRSPV